jgi:hypothetical protein
VRLPVVDPPPPELTTHRSNACRACCCTLLLQELRAAFSALLPLAELPGQWGNLSHALGGLLCASLNFVARPEATAPQAITMHHTSSSNSGWVPGSARQHVLYAALPQEASCTENLTPWLKLLPCRCARSRWCRPGVLALRARQAASTRPLATPALSLPAGMQLASAASCRSDRSCLARVSRVPNTAAAAKTAVTCA